MTFSEKLAKLDPRWIWAAVMAIVWFAVLVPFSLPVPMSAATRGVVKWVDSLPKGSNLLVATEYDPGPDVQLNPQLAGVAYLAFERGVHIICVSSGFTLGPAMCNESIAQAIKDLGPAGKNIKYGTDWVNLGYKPGSSATENELVHNFQQATAGVDFYGKPLSSYPLTKNIKTLTSKYFSGIWVEETGTPGCIDWYTNAGKVAGIPVGCGPMDMNVPTEQPYLTAGQYKALLPGTAGAAQLEQIIHHPWLGLAGENTATMAAILSLLAAIAANIVYFRLRRQRGS